MVPMINGSTDSSTGSGADTPLLSARDITHNFGAETILGGVSFDIAAGETVAIMGPSGSGKTTLLNCLSGILAPTGGEVVFDGEVISSWPDARRSALRLRKFGFVFQDGQLLPELSARDNVALTARLGGVPTQRARAKAEEMLDRLGIGHLAMRRPGAMSGGQAQRVAIARALVAQPRVVFADEPTGALDQAAGHEAIQLLTSVAQTLGATLVLVTHDSSVASWCDRLVELRDGIVHYDGRMR